MPYDDILEFVCPDGGCEYCQYLLDPCTCGPENSTYYLDVYETIWERQRCENENRPYYGMPLER